MDLRTLGDYIQLGMALLAVPLFCYLMVRAWGPSIKAGATRVAGVAGRYLQDTFMVDDVMSSGEGAGAPEKAGDSPGEQLGKSALLGIAMPSNDDTNELTVNAVDAPIVNDQVHITAAEAAGMIPSEARDYIRFQAKAEAIADLLRGSLLTNQAKAIEAVYHCSRTSSSRPETPYQRAKTLIEQLVAPKPIFYSDLRAQVVARVEAEMEAEEREAA